MGYQQRNRQSWQELKNDTFSRPQVSDTQCIIGTDKYTDSSLNLNYPVVDYSPGYQQIQEAFRCLTKDDILQLLSSYHAFRSSNLVAGGTEVRYNLYVLELRHQRKVTASQSTKEDFKFLQASRPT